MQTLENNITENIEDKLELMKSALTEAQSSVRSYDTKAQIVGVGYVFTLGVIGDFEYFLPTSTTFGTPFLDVSAAWGIAILPILLFGYVLFPTRYSTLSLQTPRSVLYIDTAKVNNTHQIENQILKCSPITEYSRELLLVSMLRDNKRKHFLRGLFAAASSFFCICVNQLYRAY